MHIVWTVIIGFAVGVIAKWISPGKEKMGFIMTVLLGIAGSVVATYGGKLIGLYQPGETAGFIGGVIGALVILLVYGVIKTKAA